jgi:hypothetical protein
MQASAYEPIAVGASDHDDRFASYSNYGRCVDLVSPGKHITAGYIDSPTASGSCQEIRCYQFV